ncbi:hypothetical protein SLE2022_267620 [Rubroshorea leprosula]
MASWLKAAEDLLEVSPASNTQDSQARRTRSITKAQKLLLTNESQKASDTTSEQTNSMVSNSDVRPDKDRATLSSENEGNPTAKSAVQTSSEQYSDNEIDVSHVTQILSSEPLEQDTVKHDGNQGEVSASVSSAEAPMSTANGSLLNENATDVLEDHPASQLPAKEIDVVSEDHLNDSGQNIKFDNADVPSKIVQERSQSATIDSPVKCEAEIRDAGVKVESQVSQKNEDKVNTQPVRVQDQLDEAQGLLKTMNSTGQSKEARLARVCAGLSSRIQEYKYGLSSHLQEYKSENAQLEELLVAKSELTKSYKARIQQLQQDLSTSKGEVTRVEMNMAEALAAKNSEIEALVNTTNALKKQAALSEGNLASLQVNMESIMRNRELTETRVMQALREAHNATKMAAMEREVELEHGAIDAATALSRIQRVADERTAKVAELEQRCHCLRLNVQH